MKRTMCIAMAAFLLLLSNIADSQIFTGVEGLLHTPSAEMTPASTLRLGAHYADVNFLTEGYGTSRTPTFYIGLTPYKWIEAAYMVTMWEDDGTYLPDRSLSVKIRPIEEGKYWPALVAGSFDPLGTSLNTNFYGAAVKHFDILGGEFGIHAAYRHYKKEQSQDKWGGIIGGITYKPNFYKGLRATVEYTGNEINLGLDACLFDFVRLQAILQDWNYFTFGLCIEIHNL